MKVKTLLIAGTMLTVLAGMTVANLNQYQQRAFRLSQAAIELTDVEKQNILLMREEEKLARDVYLVLYELWDAEIFANISESEQQHMDAVKRLITRYGLEDPVVDDTVGQFTNPEFLTLFDELVEAGSISLEEALKVGVSIEELDIADLDQALRETTKRAVRRVFLNLLRASYNHLSAFNECLVADGAQYPGQLGPGDHTCWTDPDGNMIRQGNGISGDGSGQGGNDSGQRQWDRDREHWPDMAVSLE